MISQYLSACLFSRSIFSSSGSGSGSSSSSSSGNGSGDGDDIATTSSTSNSSNNSNSSGGASNGSISFNFGFSFCNSSSDRSYGSGTCSDNNITNGNSRNSSNSNSNSDTNSSDTNSSNNNSNTDTNTTETETNATNTNSIIPFAWPTSYRYKIERDAPSKYKLEQGNNNENNNNRNRNNILQLFKPQNDINDHNHDSDGNGDGSGNGNDGNSNSSNPDVDERRNTNNTSHYYDDEDDDDYNKNSHGSGDLAQFNVSDNFSNSSNNTNNSNNSTNSMYNQISPLFAVSLTYQLYHLYKYNNRLTSDVTVKCGGELFYLHSFVLIHGSDYFRQIFFQDDDEEEDGNGDDGENGRNGSRCDDNRHGIRKSNSNNSRNSSGSGSSNVSRRGKKVYLYNMINFINLDYEDDDSHNSNNADDEDDEQNSSNKFMPPIEASSFRIVIESLYTGVLTNITNENVTSLLLTSYHLQVRHSYQSCTNYMLREINFSNCLTFWLSSKLCDCVEVERVALGLIGRHLDLISCTELFLGLRCSSVVEMLHSEMLQVSSEVSVYTAVMAWVKFDEVQRANDLSRLLDVRCLSFLPAVYLMNVVGREELIKRDKESLRIYSEAIRLKLSNDTFDGNDNGRGGRNKSRSAPSSHGPQMEKKRHHFIHGLIGSFERLTKRFGPEPTLSTQREVVVVMDKQVESIQVDKDENVHEAKTMKVLPLLEDEKSETLLEELYNTSFGDAFEGEEEGEEKADNTELCEDDVATPFKVIKYNHTMNIMSRKEKKRKVVKDIVKYITSNNDADTVIMSNRKEKSKNNNDWRKKLKHDIENIEKLTNSNYDTQYQHDDNKVVNRFVLDM